MPLIDEYQLSDGEKQLVKRWWENCYYDIAEKGYRLDEYIPSASTSWRPPLRQGSTPLRTFDEIVKSGLIISALARCEIDDKEVPVTLTHVPLEFSVKLPPNYCVPSLGMFVLDSKEHLGSHSIMVTPALRPLDKLRFNNFGDFVNFFTQMSEALHSMHENNIAYRACTAKSIVAIGRRPEDGQYQFYFGDFGFSCKYETQNEMANWPCDRKGFAPEHESEGCYNPFRTDIYYVGLLVHEKFLTKFPCFTDMNNLVNLVNEMIHDDPSYRPVIRNVVDEFARILNDLGNDADRPLESSWWDRLPTLGRRLVGLRFRNRPLALYRSLATVMGVQAAVF